MKKSIFDERVCYVFLGLFTKEINHVPLIPPWNQCVQYGFEFYIEKKDLPHPRMCSADHIQDDTYLNFWDLFAFKWKKVREHNEQFYWGNSFCQRNLRSELSTFPAVLISLARWSKNSSCQVKVLYTILYFFFNVDDEVDELFHKYIDTEEDHH